MVAMTILVMLAGGIIAGVFMVRADAENNLYESAALNVSISFLEQLKSVDYETLGSPPVNTSGAPYHEFLVGFGQRKNILMGEDTAIDVPIISQTDGSAKKELAVTVNITTTAATDMPGYWMEVDYSWRHPTNNRIYEGEVRSFRCDVPTF